MGGTVYCQTGARCTVIFLYANHTHHECAAGRRQSSRVPQKHKMRGGGAVPQIHRMLGGAQKHRMPEGPVPQKHRMQGGATEAQDAWGQCHRSTGCPLETQKLEKH